MNHTIGLRFITPMLLALLLMMLAMTTHDAKAYVHAGGFSAGGYHGGYAHTDSFTGVDTARTNVYNGDMYASRDVYAGPNVTAVHTTTGYNDASVHVDTGSNVYVNNDDYYPMAGAVVAGAAIGAVAASASAPSSSCTNVDGYINCNGTYYQQVFQGTQVVYQVVPAP